MPMPLTIQHKTEKFYLLYILPFHTGFGSSRFIYLPLLSCCFRITVQSFTIEVSHPSINGFMSCIDINIPLYSRKFYGSYGYINMIFACRGFARAM